MASTQITTTTDYAPFVPHGEGLVKAGSRLYAVYQNGTQCEYRYSDDDGATWSSAVQVKASSSAYPHAFYDSVNGRLNIILSGHNNPSFPLSIRAITSNVTSGTPGALTSEATIDAGGSNVGVQHAYAFHTATGTRPRYWVVAAKWTALDTIETRVWFVTAGTSADTGANWSSTNFTNVGSNSNAEEPKQGIGFHWTVGGSDKATIIFGNNQSSPFQYEAVTFDPTAVTPTPGTVTSPLFSLAGTGGTFDTSANGPAITAAASADYAVFGRLDRNTQTWEFYKSVDGVTWTQPTGWSGLTMGRAKLSKSGSNFYLVHTLPYGLIASSAQTMYYRLITTASNTMGGVTVFSDTSGNPISVPADTGTSKLYAMYRGSTASPFTLRSDYVSIGGAADTTAPGQADVTATVLSSTSVFVSAVMPADIDVAEYEVRYLTGATAPASNRSDGTVWVATGTAANQTMNTTITGLATSTRITGRVFVKDTSGNWNTGATFTAVPAEAPTFLGRYQANGTTPVADDVTPGGNGVILEYQLSTSCFETGGNNSHFRLRIGYDNVTPPSQSSYDLLSTAADGVFKYESSPGSWTTVPSGGLTSTNWTKKLRVYTGTSQSAQYGSVRVEQ